MANCMMIVNSPAFNPFSVISLGQGQTRSQFKLLGSIGCAPCSRCSASRGGKASKKGCYRTHMLPSAQEQLRMCVDRG